MTERIALERMSYGPAAVGRRADGKTVFVEGAAPGDVVEAEIVEEKPSFARARVASILEASPMRADAGQGCLALCGGCPWAHLSYEAQLEAKRANVADALVRTAHLDAARVEGLVASCAPSKRTWGYRNKLELGACTGENGRFMLGFYREGTHDLETPDSCPLAHKNIARAPKALRGALRFAQGAQDLGIFRVGVRGSVRTNDVEVALWTPPGPFPRTHVAGMVKSALKATSVVRVLADPGKARAIKGVEALEGRGWWEEQVGGARLVATAPSFFQVNTAQAEMPGRRRAGRAGREGRPGRRARGRPVRRGGHVLGAARPGRRGRDGRGVRRHGGARPAAQRRAQRGRHRGHRRRRGPRTARAGRAGRARGGPAPRRSGRRGGGKHRRRRARARGVRELRPRPPGLATWPVSSAAATGSRACSRSTCSRRPITWRCRARSSAR